MATPLRPWCVVPQPRGAATIAGGPSSADLLSVPASRRGTRSGGTATRTDCERALGATSGHQCLRPIRLRPYRPVRLVGRPWQRGSLIVAVAVAVAAAAYATIAVTAPHACPLTFPFARLLACPLPLTRRLPACQYALPLTRPAARLPIRPPTPPTALTRLPYRPPLVCVCLRARARVCEQLHLYVNVLCVCVCACVCLHARARACYVSMCVCAYVRMRACGSICTYM